jgi:flagellar basal-body rod protein FlgB
MSTIPPIAPVVRDRATVALHAALRGLDARQKAIADNVANVETPGYRARSVSFEDSLQVAVAAEAPHEFAVTEEISPAATRMNGNNVNLDMEVATQIETNLRQQLVVRALNAKYTMVRTAVSTTV